jgi:ABC-type transport system involved in multi-copper enzyme maturation permease subunit
MRNPIISKEVLSSLRTKKAVGMQALMFVVLAALVMVFWPADGLQDIGGQQARSILSIVAMGELLMIILFAPSFTAASLTAEMEHNTLESLFTTALKPWQIATGKMAGSLTFLLLLVICGTPALALPMLLGGVGGTELLAVVGILLVTAVYLGMIGLLISTIMHRSYRAIIVTYAILLGVCFLPALPAWPVSRNLLTRGGPFWQGVFHVLGSLSPLEAMISLLWPDSGYAIGAGGWPAFWGVYLVLAAAAVIVMGIVCLHRLRHPPAPPRPRETLRVIERNEVTARTVVWHLWFFDPRRRRSPIAAWQNPVLMKEFRTRPMLQTRWLLRAVGISLIVSILLMFLVNFSVTAFVGESPQLYTLMTTAVAALIVVMLVLMGPAVAGGVICSDRETGVWDLLRVTPIPSWRIVSGKFLASIIPLLLLFLATLPALLLLVYFDPGLAPGLSDFLDELAARPEVGIVQWVLLCAPLTLILLVGLSLAIRHPKLAAVFGVLLGLLVVLAAGVLVVTLVSFSPRLQHVCAVIGMTILFVSTAGTFFSSLFSRTATATAWTYALVVTLSLLSLLVLIGSGLFSRQFVETILVVNPVAAVMEAAGYERVRDYGLLWTHLQLMAVATAAMFAVAVARVIQLRRAE